MQSVEMASALRRIRKKLSHSKASGFFQELKNKGLECRYSYYMKMESGQVTPSPNIIEQISNCLDEASAKDLILSYCRDIFPNYGYYFEEGLAPQTQAPGELEVEKGPHHLPKKVEGRELSRRQISVLTRSKIHYYLFLVAMISRHALTLAELGKVFPKQDLSAPIRDLETARLIRTTDRGYRSVSDKHHFPSIQDFPELKTAYKQLDLWDEGFSEDLHFETRLNKMMIRRISPRYLAVIEEQMNVLISLVRTTDQIEPRYSNTLIQLRLSLKSGKLPG